MNDRVPIFYSQAVEREPHFNRALIGLYVHSSSSSHVTLVTVLIPAIAYTILQGSAVQRNHDAARGPDGTHATIAFYVRRAMS